MSLSLKGKNILITGVSRPSGIGAQLARTLTEQGANIVIHGYLAYDQFMEYRDAKEEYSAILQEELKNQGKVVFRIPDSDLSVSGEAQKVVEQACEKLGYIDGMVLNHAYSTNSDLKDWNEADINQHLLVNVTASMMMIQAFSKQLPAGKRGAITLFTSGQYLGPMTGEIAYAVSKEAVIGLTKQVSCALAPQNIQVNCVNPGPTDTGYCFGQDYEKMAEHFPAGRWGMPEDIAKLVHFLQSDYSSWITGEIIASEGGFRRDT